MINEDIDKRDVLTLSRRELHILSLMAEGHSNVGISKQLWLSVKTVETHIRSIFMKLDLPHDRRKHRRVHAVLIYLATIKENS